jgi:cysteinyl-tRNA synthetase
LDISNEAMVASEKGLQRLMEALEVAKILTPSTTSSLDISAWKKSCYDAMNDDFNTPILIANLFEGIRFINLVNDKKETLTAEDIATLTETISTFIFEILGIKDEKATSNNSEKLEGVVKMLIGMRNEARANKNFALSDQIRDELLALNIQLKDGKDGTSFIL